MLKLFSLIIAFSLVVFAKVLTPKNITPFLNSHKFVVVEYWYPDCGYCKLLVPHLNAAKRALKGVTFATFNTDIDDNAVIRNRYNVEFTPTLVIYKYGKEVSRQISTLSKQEIVNWIKKYRKIK
jgi:thiol-disulfide isomerase/thioredoxin